MQYALAQQRAARSGGGGSGKSGSATQLTETEAERYLDYVRQTYGLNAANKEYKNLMSTGGVTDNKMSPEMVKAAQAANMPNLGYNYSDENKLKYLMSMMNRK